MRLAGTPLLLAALLLFTTLVYVAGLNSRFILDDVYNLKGLADIENNGLLYYILGSGFSGADGAGRPISLLSFAVQYTAWPANPFAFKLVNLALHLVNGVLLFIFSTRLTSQLGYEKKQERLFAFLVAGLWLLHPIHVNSVLYTVQRMTQISTFFCLVGMIGYLHGRSFLNAGKIYTGMIWIIFSAYGCTVLAILGKENGILLPLYLLCIELIIFKTKHKPDSIRTGLLIILSLPVILFINWLILDYGSIKAGFGIREFTPLERVLTEATVIVNYIMTILFPRPSAFTLFHDGYPVSQGLLSPPLTLAAIMIIVISLLLSLLIRKKHPLIALGILLFFSGHILEAGPLSLELYFEHRNYFPSIGIMMVIASILMSGIRDKKYIKPVSIVTGIYFICLVTISAGNASLWSEPEVQLTGWVRAKPDSDRAKQELAMLYTLQGNYTEAEKIHEQLMQKYENDMYPVIHLMLVRTCKQNQPISEQDLERILERSAKPLRYNLAAIAALDFLALDVMRNKCEGLNIDYLEDILVTLAGNPASRMDSAILYELLSSLAINRGNLMQAVAYLQKSLAISFKVDRKLREIMLLDRLNMTSEREIAAMELKNYLDNNPRAYFAYSNLINKLQ